MTSLRENTIYASWRNVDADAFRARWPNFSPQEMACRGTGKLLIDFGAMDALQRLRSTLGRPLIINSAYRSPEHNRSLPGAATNSLHMRALAFDISMANHDPIAFEAAARTAGFGGIGHYPQSNFMHIDVGAARRWHGAGGWFTRSRETPGFTPPVRPNPTLETIKEIAPTVGPLLVGGGAIAQGDGPVQWALGIIAVAAFIAGVIWVIRRKRRQ